MVFTVFFYHFLFSRNLYLTKRHFSSDILLVFPEWSDFYTCDIWIYDPLSNIFFLLNVIILFLSCVRFFLSKRSFPAKAAVMVYILSLCCLKISFLVTNSSISRIPQRHNGLPGQNGSLSDYCNFLQTSQVP